MKRVIMMVILLALLVGCDSLDGNSPTDVKQDQKFLVIKVIDMEGAPVAGICAEVRLVGTPRISLGSTNSLGRTGLNVPVPVPDGWGDDDDGAYVAELWVANCATDQCGAGGNPVCYNRVSTDSFFEHVSDQFGLDYWITEVQVSRIY